MSDKKRKPLLSPEVRARMKTKDLARRKKIKDFFRHIADAFKQLDAHRKEKARERKLYRAGKTVKTKPETEQRLDKAKEHLDKAKAIRAIAESTVKAMEESRKAQKAEPEEVINTAPDETGNKRRCKAKPIENVPLALPEPLKNAELKLSEYISAPEKIESKTALNEAGDILKQFDGKSGAIGGVMTALVILILVYLFSKA